MHSPEAIKRALKGKATFQEMTQLFTNSWDDLEQQGIAALLAEPFLSQIPQQLKSHYHHLLINDLIQTRELFRILKDLAEKGVNYILFKGSWLGHRYYSSSYLRPRVDTDILITRENLTLVKETLLEHGYLIQPPASRERFPQIISYKPLVNGRESVIDVHWHWTNRRILPYALTFADFYRHSEVFPKNNVTLRGTGPAHSIFITVMHRYLHHPEDTHLIWYKDIHLIVSAMSDHHWRLLANLSRKQGVWEIVLADIKQSQTLFGALPHLQKSIHSTSHCFPPPKKGEQGNQAIWADFLGSKGIKNKGYFLLETLFPPMTFMKWRYKISNRYTFYGLLPFLYLWRILMGTFCQGGKKPG